MTPDIEVNLVKQPDPELGMGYLRDGVYQLSDNGHPSLSFFDKALVILSQLLSICTIFTPRDELWSRPNGTPQQSAL